MAQIVKSVENILDLNRMSQEERLKFVQEIAEGRLDVTNSVLVEFLQKHFKQQLQEPIQNPTQNQVKILTNGPDGQIMCMLVHNNRLYVSIKGKENFISMWDLTTGKYIRSNDGWSERSFVRAMTIHDDKLYYGTSDGCVGYYDLDISTSYTEWKYCKDYIYALISTGENLFVNSQSTVFHGKDYKSLKPLTHDKLKDTTDGYSIVRYEDHIYISRSQKIYKVSLDGTNVELFGIVNVDTIPKLSVVSQDGKQFICAFTRTGHEYTFSIDRTQSTTAKISKNVIWDAKEFGGKLYVGHEGKTNGTFLCANSIVIHNQTIYYGGNDGKIYYFTN